MYEDYYMNQSGTGMPIFIGSRDQRGHGIGSVLSGLFRSAVPMLKRGLASFGKHALKTGQRILTDVIDGQPIGETAKKHVLQGIKEFITPDDISSQTGSGRKRSHRSLIRKKIKKGKRRRLRGDIFD